MIAKGHGKLNLSYRISLRGTEDKLNPEVEWKCALVECHRHRHRKNILNLRQLFKMSCCPQGQGCGFHSDLCLEGGHLDPASSLAHGLPVLASFSPCVCPALCTSRFRLPEGRLCVPHRWLMIRVGYPLWSSRQWPEERQGHGVHMKGTPDQAAVAV